MYPASQEFHQAVADGAPQKALLIFEDAVFTNDDIDVSTGISFRDYFNLEEDLAIGQAPSNEISFSLLNENRLLNEYKFGAFLATLGWMMVVYGTNLLLCNKPPNNSQPLGGFLKNFTNLGSGNIAGIPIIVFFALGMCIIVHVLLTKTTLGREIFSVGSNAEAARVSPDFSVS